MEELYTRTICLRAEEVQEEELYTRTICLRAEDVQEEDLNTRTISKEIVCQINFHQITITIFHTISIIM